MSGPRQAWPPRRHLSRAIAHSSEHPDDRHASVDGIQLEITPVAAPQAVIEVGSQPGCCGLMFSRLFTRGQVAPAPSA